MDKYIKFSEAMEYLRNRNDEARKCGHEETYFDLLTIIDGLKNMETVPANTALDHIHNVVRDDAYRRGYEQGKKDAAPKWIPVSERLPDEEGRYFVTDDSGGEKWVDSSAFLRIDDESVYWDFANVTAWMPLPEPYKEGEQHEPNKP